MIIDNKTIIQISDEKMPSFGRFGPKGTRLLEVRRAGFDVPDGIILSVEFLEEMIKSCGLEKSIKDIIKQERKSVSNLDRVVIDLFRGLIIDKEAHQDLMSRVHGIEGFRDDINLAVRSAALGEDDETSSFAGQYTTILDVPIPELWSAIIQCYASWWSDRVCAYRKKNKTRPGKPLISIIVQRQLSADNSGVLFTEHPLETSKRDLMVVEAVEGLGEKLVSGEVTPMRWELNSYSGKIVSREVPQSGKTFRLSSESLKQLSLIGHRLEDEFGEGLDIEWAIENGSIFVLQVRPITTDTTIFGKTVQLDKILPVSPSELTEHIYSRAIVEDLWSDRMSNITSSIVFDEFADLYTFKTPLKRLGFKEIASLPGIKVINGYGYINTQAISLLLEVFPPYMRFREIENMFPPMIRERVLQTPFRISKILGKLYRLPLFVNDPAMLPFLTIPLLRRHLKNIENETNRVDISDYISMDIRELGIELERLLKLQGRLQVRNQWGYGNATMFTWMLHHFATKYFGKSEEWVLARMSNVPDNITFESQRKLKEIADHCDSNIIKIAFGTKDGAVTWKILEERFPEHKVTLLIREFINEYRYRSSNRDFIHPRWDEKPALVADLIALLIQKNHSDSNLNNNRIIEKSGNSIAAFFGIPVLFFLGRLVRRYLALREDLRFGLDKIFYQIRHLLLSINQRSEFSSLCRIENGIFFLELNELRTILSEENIADDLLPKVRKREKSFRKEKAISPPYYIRIKDGSWEPLETEPGKTINLHGIAASSGSVTGKARVIKDSSQFNKLKKGEILIAYNTDPGWTPLFMTASGVIVEMGGILNHCAIVAREYGIPAVVGVSGITNMIKDGQLVRVNGSSGSIEIL